MKELPRRISVWTILLSILVAGSIAVVAAIVPAGIAATIDTGVDDDSVMFGLTVGFVTEVGSVTEPAAKRF
jgi:hypothetical protein